MSKNYCKFCGERIYKSDIFCKGCGQALEQDEDVQDAVIDKDKTSKQETNNLMVSIVVLLAFIIMASLFIILFRK